MTKILLTGHNGLVGKAISNIVNVITYPKRINDYDDFLHFLNEHKIEIIIHTAAKVGGVKANYENKIDFYLENSKLNNIVFEASINCPTIKRFINFSSTCVFPYNAIYPLNEVQIFYGPPHYTNDAYAYSKRMMQYLCEQKENYFTLIPTNIFGPHDNYNLQNGHVIPSLIHKCYLAKQNNTDFVVWGSGNPLREFIYSKDLAKIVFHFLFNNPENEKIKSFIISNEKEISIKDCAYQIANAFDFKGKIVFDESGEEGQFRKPTDTSLLKYNMPGLSFTPFDTAIQESVEWFIENYEIARK